MNVKLAAILGAIGLVSILPATQSTSSAAVLPPINLEKMCTTYCYICPSELDHENAKANAEGATNTGTIHNCGESIDCRFHNGCTMGLMAVNDVWEAARHNDVQALKTALAKYKTLASVNRERSAVQILNCERDLLIAHVPVSSAVLSQLGTE